MNELIGYALQREAEIRDSDLYRYSKSERFAFTELVEVSGPSTAQRLFAAIAAILRRPVTPAVVRPTQHETLDALDRAA